MNQLHKNLSRIAAIGLGVALIGGGAIVSAQTATADPAHSWQNGDVYASDFEGDGAAATGWRGYSQDDSNNYSVTDDGLSLVGAGSVQYEFPEAYSQEFDVTSYLLKNDSLKWDSTGVVGVRPTLNFSFGSDESVGIWPLELPTGAVTAASTDAWVTGRAIGSFETYATATLGELVDAIAAESNPKLVSIGLTTGESTLVTSFTWGTEYTFHEGTRIEAGSVALTGGAHVGSVLTATPVGWPEGTTFTYEWYAITANRQGGSTLESTSSTYALTDAELGMTVGAKIVGSKTGLAPDFANTVDSAIVTNANLAATDNVTPAPVATSGELAAYLKNLNVTPQTQASAGLPAGALDPAAEYTATAKWMNEADSFVDVYAYSSPIFVGTFAVIDGVVQVKLSPALMKLLAAGGHTLVYTGQSSGSVQAVLFQVGELAETGVSSTLVPIGVASSVLLLGASILLLRRRRTMRV